MQVKSIDSVLSGFSKIHKSRGRNGPLEFAQACFWWVPKTWSWEEGCAKSCRSGLFHGGDKIYQSRDRNSFDFAQAFSDNFLNRRSYEVRSSAKSGWPLRALTMDPEIYKSRARNRPIWICTGLLLTISWLVLGERLCKVRSANFGLFSRYQNLQARWVKWPIRLCTCILQTISCLVVLSGYVGKIKWAI